MNSPHFPRLKEILVQQLGVNPEQVTPDARFIEDLGADSLDTVELIMAVEEEFGIDIDDESAERMLDVKGTVAYLDENAD